jgi:hypothetical protein
MALIGAVAFASPLTMMLSGVVDFALGIRDPLFSSGSYSLTETEETISLCSKLFIWITLSFIWFKWTLDVVIVRRVKERIRKELHQKYAKLLEEKDIRLEDE